MRPTHNSSPPRFRRGLRSAIGANMLRAADADNNGHTSNYCHTHDYCDANVYMAAAFRRIVGREIDLQSDADARLWGAAWAKFKAEGRRAVL